jgi:hypothetical protein
MTTGYYAYVIGPDGHIMNRIDVGCDNDEEAKSCALQLVDGHAIELWQEARRVATFQPKQ